MGMGKLAAGPGHLGLREQVVRRPGPGEVTLEVLAAGICGTDLHIADDEFPSDPPVTMGHEVSGEVAVVGEGVDPSWLGIRAACETYATYCGVCERCREGRVNLCGERLSIGSHVDGGFARWLTLPVRNLHAVPDRVGVYAGAIVEPLACVAQILFDPPVVSAGERVLVVGPGAMGVITAQALRAAGGDVLVVGLPRDRVRLRVAAGLGLAVATLDGDDDVGRFDVVCECSGAEAGVGLAIASVRRGGTYVQVGLQGKPVQVDLDALVLSEIAWVSGFASTPRSWRRAMALLARGHVELDPLITEVVPLSRWEHAFRATREAAGMKYVLDPREGAS
jgi:L-iditol 2-dehydrogenase